MERWSNWSGKLRAEPAAVHHVRTESDAAAVAARANEQGSTVRCVGTGHSHAPLVPTDDTIVDVSGLNGVISVNRQRRRALIRSGTTIHGLGMPLLEAGLGLINQGDIDRQTIAGVTATGTHGTGAQLQNFSSAVTGLRLATASGDLVWASADQNAELWSAARQHLGAFGIVTEVEIQAREAYRLRESGFTEPLDDMLSKLSDIVHRHRHFEFFWFPTTDMVVAKATDETDDHPEYPIGDEGSRCGWSHEVLSSRRTWPHTEMEYAVPLELGPRCLGAIRDMVKADFPEMGWPVEYRVLAADDVWLSVAYERPTATISVHVDAREDDEPLFRACEEIFGAHDGRPHWGKVHYRSGAALKRIHERWDDWWRVRDEIDPNGTFLNDHLRALRDSA